MQKQDKIIDMFNQIAPTYDRANRIISLGSDTNWRLDTCELVLRKIDTPSINIVDVACGTGDMMGIWSKKAGELGINVNELIGVDPSSGMLDVAKSKFPNFNFIEAKADELGISSSYFDILSISYGIRNVVLRQKALIEFNRVLKTGAYLVILEFTKPNDKGFIAKLRDLYISKILPIVGGIVSNNKKAYEYFPNSIENFIDRDGFRDEIIEAGFEIELIKGYSFDVSTLFLARKVRDA